MCVIVYVRRGVGGQSLIGDPRVGWLVFGWLLVFVIVFHM
jgi:hypothetical protein